MNEAVIQGKDEIALLEDGALVGYRKITEGSVQAGDVFWGRLVKCASGDSDGCFVDIGLQENAFCAERGQVQQGSFLPVMAVSAAHDNKPVRVSFDVKITGRLLVLLSREGACGISGKISEEGERQRLKAAGESILAADENIPGLILRTEAAGAELSALQEEARRLGDLWDRIRKGKDSPGLLTARALYSLFKPLTAFRQYRHRRRRGLREIADILPEYAVQSTWGLQPLSGKECVLPAGIPDRTESMAAVGGEYCH